MNEQEKLKEENAWLWRQFAESDHGFHDEVCGGSRITCFWCQRAKINSPKIYFSGVTDEDIEEFKKLQKPK